MGAYNEENDSNSRRRGRQRARQQRAGRLEEIRAVESFRDQSRQFDRGKIKFKERLGASTGEMIDFVNKENEKSARKGGSKGLGLKALEIARRAGMASVAIHQELHDLLRTGNYGHVPREKPDNCFRVMFENWNSLGVFTGDGKIGRINRMATEYDVDALAGCESQCDWRFADHDRQFDELFGVGKQKRSAVGYNVQEKALRNQKGGTAMMTMGRMSSFVVETGVDDTKLGRWSWSLMGAAGSEE